MGRPPKSSKVISMEKVSHRTKKELETRTDGETSLLSGKPLSERPEVKHNPASHQEFLRVRKLMKAIEKDDDIYTSIINRYCLLYAECLAAEEIKAEFVRGLERLVEEYENREDFDLKPSKYYDILSKIQGNINQQDKILSDKRKMMLAIEKECAMTIASALRTVPKKPKEEVDNDPMSALLGRRA